MSMVFLQEEDRPHNTEALNAFRFTTGQVPAAHIDDLDTLGEIPATKPQEQTLPDIPLVKEQLGSMVFTRRAHVLVCSIGYAFLSDALVESLRAFYKAYSDVPLLYLSSSRTLEAMAITDEKAAWYSRLIVASMRVDDKSIVCVERSITWV